MQLEWSDMFCSECKSRWHPSATLLFLVIASTTLANPQNVPTTTPIFLTSTDGSTMSRSTTSLTARPPKSMTISFTTATSSNTTSSILADATTDLPPTLGIPPAASGSDPTTRRNESVFNYYFLFLAVFGVLIAVGLWLLHRRRKRRKELMRLSGQNALARDLDGWVNSRRWMYGRWRHNQAAAFVRREEGLDENGEAPPPYQPKGEPTVSQSNAVPHQETPSITIPLQTLPRDEVERMRPPEYRILEAGHPRLQGSLPDAPVTSTARPDTARTHTNTSTRGPMRQGRDS